MGETGQSLVFPTKKDIIRQNERHIEQSGGFLDGAGKFHNENSLEWVLTAIQYPLFGFSLYPTISEKAAILAWTIIHNHVFLDGNKRTGISTMIVFLRLNGFYISAKEDEIFDVALKIANPGDTNYSPEKFTTWIKERLSILLPPAY